ncbi:MAG: hypothetical protein J6Q54_07075 [Oscillospiraceae bacterium]|nr:hypothetical protein [Oscillospiraceae bacterium]
MKRKNRTANGNAVYFGFSGSLQRGKPHADHAQKAQHNADNQNQANGTLHRFFLALLWFLLF